MKNDPPTILSLDVAARDDESATATAEHAEGQRTESPSPPMPNAGMDDEVSQELARLFEERVAKDKRKARRHRIFNLCGLLAIAAGGGWWFVSNPDRVEEAQQVISKIRASISPDSVSETYQESLDRMASRNDDISDAAKLLGVSEDDLGGGDPGMTQEMKAFTGEDDR